MNDAPTRFAEDQTGAASLLPREEATSAWPNALPHWPSGAPSRLECRLRVGVLRHALTTCRYSDKALGGPVLVRLAGFLGRSVGRLGGGAVRIGRNRFASLLTPIGVVTRRRTRTGRRILARAVSQQTRQLMQPPSQFLELLARHPREVGALDIVQLWGESARHIERRIPFAPKRKPPSRRSDRDRLSLIRSI